MPILEEIEALLREYKQSSPFDIPAPNRLEIPKHRLEEFADALQTEIEPKEIQRKPKKEASSYDTLIYKGMHVQISEGKHCKIQLWNIFIEPTQ